MNSNSGVNNNETVNHVGNDLDFPYMNLHLKTDTNLLNLNSNLLCSIFIETSGPRPKYHDLIEIAILPLNADLNPHKGILPFYCSIVPKRPENIDFSDLYVMCPGPKLDRIIHADGSYKSIGREKILRAMNEGIDAYLAADRLDVWIKKINFKFGKKLTPLSYCYHEALPFMYDWLGLEQYNQTFNYYYRDIVVASLFLNDRSDFMAEQIPIPKLDLTYICSCLRINWIRHSDTLGKCLAIAKAYKELIMRYQDILPNSGVFNNQ